ncbi:hypothetical protein [Rhodoferax sp. WC2427]
MQVLALDRAGGHPIHGTTHPSLGLPTRRAVIESGCRVFRQLHGLPRKLA